MLPKLHRGYDDDLRVDWDNGRGGYSSICLMDEKNVPVAVVLGEYVPGEADERMESVCRLFEAAAGLLSAARALVDASDDLDETAMPEEFSALRAAIAKAGR